MTNATTSKRLRLLTVSEERGLSEAQKGYLLKNPNIVSLQPSIRASEALYLTACHGAVTIDRAMELDAIHASYHAKNVQMSKHAVDFDGYSTAEDRFIDQHGMSSALN